MRDTPTHQGTCISHFGFKLNSVSVAKRMFTHNNQLRLTPKEQKQLTGLTGSDSSYIKTKAQLNQFIQAHLVNFPGRSAEERLLKKMLESFILH